MKHGHAVAGEFPPEYSPWAHMLSRCRNANDEHFPLYGARGITVCERWFKFENFLSDVGPRPSSAHGLERLNVDGNYQPGNVIWAIQAVQSRNKRTNILVTIDGETLCLADWADRFKINRNTVYGRFFRGCSVADALNLSPAAIECVSYCGKGAKRDRLNRIAEQMRAKLNPQAPKPELFRRIA